MEDHNNSVKNVKNLVQYVVNKQKKIHYLIDSSKELYELFKQLKKQQKALSATCEMLTQKIFEVRNSYDLADHCSKIDVCFKDISHKLRKINDFSIKTLDDMETDTFYGLTEDIVRHGQQLKEISDKLKLDSNERCQAYKKCRNTEKKRILRFSVDKEVKESDIENLEAILFDIKLQAQAQARAYFQKENHMYGIFLKCLLKIVDFYKSTSAFNLQQILEREEDWKAAYVLTDYVPECASDIITNPDCLKELLVHNSKYSIKNRFTAPTQQPYKLKAWASFQAEDSTQLSLSPGDLIIPLSGSYNGWRYGKSTDNKSRGWFPVSYCEKTS